MNDSSVIQLCQQLVRAPSFSGEEQLAADIAARAMRDLGFDDVCVDAYGSVIGVRRGARPGKTILFDAHLDVVAVTNRDVWTREPFGGEIVDGKIFGRGACDDKGPLAAMICAAASVPREQLAGQIIVSASVCEENLTGAALAPILDQHQPDLVIIGEPTELKLGIAQKGRAGIVVHAHGKSAHTSRPELGENAVYKMIEIVNRVRTLALPSAPDLGRAIIELTEIESAPRPGSGFVPHTCHAHFVARILPGESRVLEKLRDAIDGIAGVEIELEELTVRCYTGATLAMPDFIAGWRADETGVRKMREVLQVDTFAAPFGTNASVCAARGLPVFILGPGSIEQAHVIDEWIAIEELLVGEKLYWEVIRAFLFVR